MSELKIFDQSNQQVSLFISLINKAASLFPNTYVSTELFEQGYIQYKGVIVSLKGVEHKFIFDYYEKTFLETFNSFFKKMWEEREAQTNVFAFRVLLELAVENSFILFNQQVDPKDKELFLLITLLVDYASINTPMSGKFYSWFGKLFDENKSFLEISLKEKDFKLISRLEASLTAKGDKTILIKKTRRLLNQIKGRILEDYKRKGIYSPTRNYIGLSSGLSHIMHGNVLLIQNAMKDSCKTNHLFRVYSHLFISGISILDQIVLFHNNKEFTQLVSEFKDQHNVFSKLFRDAWVNYSKKRRN